jgi:hypothetical protein
MGTVTFSTAVSGFELPRVKVTVPSRRAKITVPLTQAHRVWMLGMR